MVEESDYTTVRYQVREHTWVVTVQMRQQMREGSAARTNKPGSFTYTVIRTGYDAVPKLKLSAKRLDKPSRRELLEGAGEKLAGMVTKYIQGNYKYWLGSYLKRGVRGKVLYVLIRDGADSSHDEAILEEVGVPHASKLLRSR